MQTPVRGAWRLVRAAVVASTVVGLAASAHRAAGGMLPGPVLLLALTALVLCASLLLAARRLSAPVLLTVLGAGQLALHQAFCWFGVPVVSVHPAGHHLDPSASADTLQGSADALHAGAVAVATPMTALPGSSLAMTAAHVLATVVAALVLARGEALLWRLWTWWQPLRVVALTVLRLPVLPRVPRFPVVTVPRPSFVVARRVPRRGPPRVPALASTTG